MSAPESAATPVGITFVSPTKSALSPVPSKRFEYSGGRRIDDRINNANMQGHGQAATGLIVHGVETRAARSL